MLLHFIVIDIDIAFDVTTAVVVSTDIVVTYDASINANITSASNASMPARDHSDIDMLITIDIITVAHVVISLYFY